MKEREKRERRNEERKTGEGVRDNGCPKPAQ